MGASQDSEILNIEDAAALFGVSQRTFKKVLRTEELPARKIGREWKFSRRALLDWVAEGRSSDYIREEPAHAETSDESDD
ncbi:MAG: helix-turn-helix domain-containing protein [Planctomycetota bacterium]